MSGFYGQYLDTIGMEYESSSMDIKAVQRLLTKKLPALLGQDWRNVNITKDASTEFMADTVRIGGKELRLSIHTNAAQKLKVNHLERFTMGFEIFTYPLSIAEFSKTTHALFNVLQSAGDYTSHRNSTHFHVGFVNNLRMLKNFLRMSLNLEPIFYKIGGMGGVHRGFENNYNYCRPLMNSAVVPVLPTSRKLSDFPEPPPQTMEEIHLQQAMREARAAELAKLNGKYKQVRIANPMAALSAETIQQFWASFGIDYVSSSSIKYHPVRYSGFNFFAVSMHKTMEVRHCNQSLDSFLTIAIGKLVRSMIELSTVLGKNEVQRFDVIEPYEEIDMRTAVSTLEMVLSMCYEREIENLPSTKEMNLIYETMEDSSVKPIPRLPMRTHIKEFALDPYVANLGNLQEVTGEVLEPCQVDIHNIGLQSIYDKED